MLKKVVKNSCLLPALLLVGCLNTPSPNSVQTHQFIYQPSDDGKSCDGLYAEMNEIQQNIDRSKRSFTDFMMGKEEIDVSSFEKRYERLKNLYNEKGCGKMKH